MHPFKITTRRTDCAFATGFLRDNAQDVAGYSDDVINDAFDGEPDAYWNID